MANQRFVRNCARYGAEATLTQITGGDDCPCRLTYDGENPTYSKEWHDNNPSIEDCLGTLKINRETTETNVKFFVTDIRLSETTQALQKEIKETIGNILRDDLAVTGTVNVDEMIFVDLSDADEKDTYVTVNSKIYRIKAIFELRTRDLDGQLLILRRDQ